MQHPLFDRLAAAGQQHVLAHYPALTPAARRQLDQQLATLDLDLLARLVREEHEAPDWAALARRATSPPAIELAGRATGPITPEAARRAGAAALRAGQVGAILVAGGQGTRLGFAHPKGMFPLGPVSGRTLFQILIEKVVATSRRYGAPVPLYVMTSPVTHDETTTFLAAHHHFGMPTGQLRIFCQGTMPAVDAQTGRLLLARKDSLALAPDGHGGMLAALDNSGLLEDARERGVGYFSYVQIDNPLAMLCDPELLGYHCLARSEMTTQVVRKSDPHEKVGNVVMVDGKLRIIEYSDLPDDVAQRRNPDGSLCVWAGSIAVHVFDREFLDRIAHQADALPFHLARKKTPFVDEGGVAREPTAPNAIKFERFIFDLLPWARNALVVEGRAAEVFAPVKNADGAASDTPTTARRAMVALFTQWLRQAGATVVEDTPVEISPLWALDAAQVAQRLAQSPPARTIDQPTYFHE
ncbi:MAG: UTP--glucose-1-phosphate uridylyltransferase [Pirellulaceae bacterium]|jgi:UDP-N-acetylglucosamine/UDP-N-acetylgalactosamine diphosphorylase|nr:UTP--glucose-1-phosphate uridylyltransferase [Pirellulaceae bacterium]